ncbi:uncharacterized protein LOC105278842 isoform X1 [Ooceraea biroi]|uniref:uncharacterized protein LOC105278842 isoform X1 n=1 Tax=Ooceraea biroi TaxID=2015173 RepID=UPI0005BB62F4|nr:uncharacterized protein LOC105278842 isoform X1 [Ooceraea biroi]XP_011336542.1 uncharacterized protein LOC105278842 isoform X1 [Ooceraea biroi]
MLALLLFGALVALSSAQFQPQPGGRILESPIPMLCAQRTIHQRFNGKGYFFSWNDPRTAGQEVDWLTGRNFCRQRCMDLVSLETSAENEFIKSRIVQSTFSRFTRNSLLQDENEEEVLMKVAFFFLTDKVKYIWTSGRLCDFKGCDRPDLQPLNINGWFWTAELQKLAPTNERGQNDWSESGGIGKPQPDNREAIQGGAPENCLAVLNQFYNDGVNWHDVACHHKKPWVCEENESLLRYVRFANPNIRV